MGSWLSSPVLSMRYVAPSRFSTRWPSVTSECRTSGASNSASGSISATSSRTGATSTAMVLTSRRDSKLWPSLAGSASIASYVNQVRDKLDFAFEDAGEQRVKNIARPLRVYHVRPGQVAGGEMSAPQPPLALPDKPSLAVLPFTNMSGDPEQEFVSDGIAEDVITALSRHPSLFVIARNSTFTYKGRAVDVR